MEFELKMVYDQADVGALVRTLQFRSHPERNIRSAVKIGYTIFGVLLIVVSLSVLFGLVLQGLIEPITILFTVVTMVVGIVLLRRSDGKAMERRSWKRYPNKGMTLTYRFGEEGFEEEDEASGENKFEYRSITSINEDAGHYFLFTAENAAHIIKKDSFIQGDAAAFAEFIRTRCAVTIDPIE